MGDDLYVYFGTQVKEIVYSFAFGLVLSMMYDILRLLRTFLGCGLYFKPLERSVKLPLIGSLKSLPKEEAPRTLLKTANETAVFVFDIIYAVFAITATLLFLYAVSDGIVRSYSVLAMAAAFVLYMKTVAVLTGNTAGAIIVIVRIIFAYTVFFTVRPIVFLFKKTIALTAVIYSVTVGRCIEKRLEKLSVKKQNEYFDDFEEIRSKSIKIAILGE